MKKILTLLTLITTICSCNTAQENVLSIACPTGAPAIAFYKYASKGDNVFETNSNPTNIVAMMAAGKKDIIVLPTNAGAQAIKNKNAPYKLEACITFGNFYIASTGHDDDSEMNEGDNIILFQQKNVPDVLFHYIYGTQFDNSISYVPAVSDASRTLISETFTNADGETNYADYVLIAEPALTNVMNKKDNVTIYASLQEKYKELTSCELFQSSVFIKNDVDRTKVDEFMKNLKNDINELIDNSSILDTYFDEKVDVEAMYGMSKDIAKNVISNGNKIGLGFQAANENMFEIISFLEMFKIEGLDETIFHK